MDHNKNGFEAGNFPRSYWLEVPPVQGSTEAPPQRASIVVIGSGLSGASSGYWLQKTGFEDVLMVDYEVEQAATFRNAGHILYGTVESMKALSEIHGAEKAKQIWQFSIDICEQVGATIRELGIDADYRQDGYLVVSIDKTEEQECRESVELLTSMGFQSEFVPAHVVNDLGFKNCYGARYEKGSAQAHPTKFRNGLVKAFTDKGGLYHSGVKVTSIEDTAEGVVLQTSKGPIHADAVVLATNAYTPLVEPFFRGLIDPFRGQIITSKPLKNHRFPVRYPHSFDHGYEYSLITEDNRLLIGGWRHHSSTREVGTYSIEVNPFIEQGLKDFVEQHYNIEEQVEWEFSWSGIMAASRTSLPFIGATTSPRVYACAGYTGHGFSWAHGSAKLLADIIAGNPLSPEQQGVAHYFNPKLAK